MILRSIARGGMYLVQRAVSPARETWQRLRNPQLRSAFAVSSHLTTDERVMLFRLARGRQMVCEIGSYIGASACCFGAALKDSPSGKILCIDTWQNDAMTEGQRDTYDLFRKNTRSYESHIVMIRGYSTEVVDIVATHTSRFDLLFIDGDHSYEGVKADWESYKRFLGPGSVVVFHDCGWAEGVQRVIAEDAAPLVSSSAHLPNMWWGTLGTCPA